MEPTGVVFDIQRFSIHDGPGIRTLIFLKGCPLRCPWCCNPESQASRPELLFDAARCLGCCRCVAACPTGAAAAADEGFRFERTLCVSCGCCADACLVEARSLSGRRMSVGAVMDKALRDIPFYQRSGGGVTLGGGEPLAQPEFAAAILAACRRQGVHTAIETCGHVSPNVLENILRWTDLVLYDLKHVDMSVCRATLGADLALILANLERATESGAAITIRTPLIPGFNDRPDVLAAIAGRVRRLGVEEMHLLPYHRLGRRKNALLGREDPFAHAEPLPAGRLEMLLQAVATTGMRVVLGG